MTAVGESRSVGSASLPRLRSLLEALRRSPLTFRVGLSVLVIWLLAAFVGPLILQADPTAMDIENSYLLPPSPAHPFGTDNFGRDVFVRVVYGAALDLQIGIFATVPSLILGTAIGLISGYYGGVLDTVIMRLVDTMTALPFIVLVIAIVAVLGAGIQNMYIAVLVTGWISYARVSRNYVRVVRSLDYVSAARTLGFSDRRILLGHILPNVVVPNVVMSTSQFVNYVLLGSALGFLGLGVIPPTPEWGGMIADGRLYMQQGPWMPFFPGLCVVFAGAGMLFFGDGLADVLRVEENRK
jgi:peptide/nickel transport system permease protein